MNEVALTGANGMTGCHMISLLKRKGIRYRAVTRQEWDLTEWKSFDELDDIFGSASAVFHFGAQLPYSDFDNKDRQTQKTFDVNVRSCVNLAEWAKSRNVAIIFLSSSVVYKNPQASKIIETDSKVINGLGGFYGYSKVLAEGVLSHLSESGLKCAILRPSSIYGFGLPSDKLVQNYINIASSNGLIEIKNAKNRINFIHAYDVSNAALQAFNNRAWGVFNISSDKKNTILEVAEIAISISGSGSLMIKDDNKHDSACTRFDLDSKLAKESFGFDAKISLKEGMTLMKNKMVAPC
jgi:UDP-glucose 4-epimerase